MWPVPPTRTRVAHQRLGLLQEWYRSRHDAAVLVSDVARPVFVKAM
jgi:hypothetical protein